ncbi:MAG: DUF692 domain-containing protein [Myxococcota bacterium]
MTTQKPQGVGLGFRFDLADELLRSSHTHTQFIEIAPENYLRTGGWRKRLLDQARERFSMTCHGLCGDLAGVQPLDKTQLLELKAFLQQQNVAWYSDHLCYTSTATAHIHDLVPLPFCQESIERTATRIQQVQDILQIPLAIENVSAYMRMAPHDMSEQAFVSAVAERASCHILLDVNNVYVNACNFGFDPKRYIDELPLQRVIQVHVAGHEQQGPGLLIDSHGEDIIDPVYDLLRYALNKMPQQPPVLLERDNNIPPLAHLEQELKRLHAIWQEVYACHDHKLAHSRQQPTPAAICTPTSPA